MTDEGGTGLPPVLPRANSYSLAWKIVRIRLKFLRVGSAYRPHPPPRAVPLPQGEGWGSFFEGIRSTGHSITSTTPNLTHPSICNHVHSIPKKTRFQLGVLTKKTLIFCAPVSISFQAEKEAPPISIRFPHAYFPPHYIIPLFLQILLPDETALDAL